MIRAMPALIRQPGLQKLTYRIAGECSDSYRRELNNLAEALGVADRVIIEGRVSDQRVVELLSEARCFVLMSVCESFGIPAIEAMSFGTPVVTSDCCAMPEVCGDAAVLVPVDDLNALTHHLSQALTDAKHAEELRRRGVVRIEQFAWKAAATRLAAVLDELIVARARIGGQMGDRAKQRASSNAPKS